jgi:outer membrane lipoprotein-sorting protein
VNSHTPRLLIHRVAENGIPDSYDGWPSIVARIEVSRSGARRPFAWRWAVASLIALIVVLFAGGTLFATTTPAPVSAQELVDRAGAASDGLSSSVRSYHITAITSLQPADPTATPIVQHEETWFNGPGRMRQETHTSDWSTITVTDGPQSWWSVTRGGHTYVAPASGIRFSDMAYLNPLVPEGTSITSVLAFLGRQGCGTFRLQPDQTVAGRDAYVVSATHTLQSMLDHQSGCGNPIQLLTAPSPSPAPESNPAAEATAAARVAEKRAALATPQPAGQASSAKPLPQPAAGPSPSAVSAQPAKPLDVAQPSEVQRLLNTTVVDTFWIDKQTFVPLKAEQNLGPKGASQYEVTRVEFDLPIPDGMFKFTPPSGADVLPDLASLKQILANR